MEWESVEIKDIAVGIYDGPHATPKESEDGPIFLGISELTPQGGIDLSNATHLSEDDFLIWTRRVTPRANDIVFSYEATLHRYAIIPNDLRCCLGRRLALIRVDDSKADYRFVYYSLLSPAWKNQVEARTIAGATVERIPLIEFPSFKLKLPPLPIQRRIAEVLGHYDALIENYQRQISILEAAAEALYREWFVRMRFHNNEEVNFVEDVPEGWKYKTIGELCLKVTDGSHYSPEFSLDGKYMASVKDMHPTGFSLSSMKTISEEDFDRLVKADCMPRKYDVLIAKDGSYLKHVFVWDHDYEVVILSSIAILRPNLNLILPYFLSLALKQDSTKSMMSNYVSGSALPRIILDDFKKMQLLIPTFHLMQNFESIVEPMFKKILNHLEQIETLRQMRDKFLPRLMSGQIPLAAAE